MARLDWQTSITPIEETVTGVDGGPVQVDTISYSHKKPLGGGTSNSYWGGAESPEWVNGAHTHISSSNSIIDMPASQGIGASLWIKNTGFLFNTLIDGNKGPIASTNKIQVKVNQVESQPLGLTDDIKLCELGPGEGILFPARNTTGATTLKLMITKYSGQDAVAVEYAIFRHQIQS